MIGKILTIIYFTTITIFGLEMEFLEHGPYLIIGYYFIVLIEYLSIYQIIKNCGLI